MTTKMLDPVSSVSQPKDEAVLRWKAVVDAVSGMDTALYEADESVQKLADEVKVLSIMPETNSIIIDGEKVSGLMWLNLSLVDYSSQGEGFRSSDAVFRQFKGRFVSDKDVVKVELEAPSTKAFVEA